MKHISRGTLLKRRSTRHVSEVTAIASEFGNSAKIIVPRSWLGRRVIAFLHSDYISKHAQERTADEQWSLVFQCNSICWQWLCNGFCSEKGLEVDTNYHRLLGRDGFCKSVFFSLWSTTKYSHGNDRHKMIKISHGITHFTHKSCKNHFWVELSVCDEPTQVQHVNPT